MDRLLSFVFRVRGSAFSNIDARGRELGFSVRPLSDAQPVFIFLGILMTKHPGVSQFSINRYTAPGLPS